MRYLASVMAISAACGSVSSDNKQDAAMGQLDAPPSDAGATDALTCAPAAPNLNARWRADGNAMDDGGNAYHGATVGNSFSYAPGRHGMAFLLDGTTNFVRVNDNDALWPAASFSVAAWVKTSSSGELITKYQCAGSCPASSFAYYSLRVDPSGKPTFELRTDASGTSATITDSVHNIADGNWHHLVGTRDVPAMASVLYVDGAVVGMLPLAADKLGPMTNTDGETDFVTLGAGIVGGTQNPTTFLSGALDEVAFYKSALTAAQVMALYSAPQGECP